MTSLFKVLLAAVFCAATCSSHAYIFSQVGVDSNLLIDGDRVVFAQSDGSLTALTIETGQVLRRVKGRDFSGTLRRVAPGILVLNYGSIALLNPTNFASIWETTSHYNPTVLSNSLVSYDGYGLVENRELSTGKVRWSFDLPGALDVVAESGRVLIHRAATYEDDVPTTTVLLDLETGKELFRKTPPPRIHWSEAFLDGETIYLIQGTYEGKRSDYKLEKLIVWDIRGEEIGSLPLSSKLQTDLRWGSSSFDLDGKTFFRGHIFPDRWAIPNERFGRLLPLNGRTNDAPGTAYDLGDGFVFVEREDRIEMQSPEGNWSGMLPYLSRRGRIAAVSRASGRLLIGSNLGHVECVNATTGESLWLYVFPTIRQTMSFSSHGMPPMMSKAAATFRKENQSLPSSGLSLVNQSPVPTHLILDPEPTNPFERLPLLLAVTWGAAVIPVFALALLRLLPQSRKWNLGLVSVALAALVFWCFMHFGRVSPGSSIALRIALLVAVAIGTLDAVKYMRGGKPLVGAIVIGVFAAIMLLMLPFLIRI